MASFDCNPPGVIRTPLNAHHMFASTDWVFIGIALCLGPSVIGGAIALLLAGPFRPWTDDFFAESFVENFAEWFFSANASLVPGPFITIWFAPIVLGLFALLMRFGRAGWVVVGGSALLAAVGVALWHGSDPAFAIYAAALHAWCLWAATSYREIDALVRP